MTYRKIFLAAIIAFLFSEGTAYCQNDRNSEDNRYVSIGRAYHADDTAVVRGVNGVGWVRSHLFDDWFFQLQGGGQLFYGTEDRLGPFFDRLTGNAEFHFGRRIFPMFGFRGNIGIGYSHGFLSKDTYATHSISGGTGQCGPGLQGYYWDFNDELYIQKWKSYYLGIDLFLDLGLFAGANKYNPNKKWNHIIYGGVDTKFNFSEVDTINHRSEAHIGYTCKYNISPSWSVYTDARLSFIERLFDREWISGIETPGPALDPIFNLHVGLMYKFHARTPEERDQFKSKDPQIELSAEAVSHFMYVKMVDTNMVTIKDTSVVDYTYEFVPTQQLADSIRDLENEADKWRALLNARVGDNPDSAALGILLPYEQIFFELDKWVVLPQEERKIEKMAQIMLAYPNEKFILIGSADSKTGSVERNIFLSHHRTDTVFHKLVYEYGIDPNRLQREYRGGILDYMPFPLNRCTVILMDHPYVRSLFEEMRKQGNAGGRSVEIK